LHDAWKRREAWNKQRLTSVENFSKVLRSSDMRVVRLGVLLAALAATGCHSSTSPTTTTNTPATTTTMFTLAISGSSVLTGLHERSQMVAIITNADGTTQDVTKSSTWLSSDTLVATVTPSGVVTTIAAGPTHLTAVYQTTAQGFDVEVVPVTTTFAGTLQSSDGRNGTFAITVHGATDPTSNAVSALVDGTLRIQGDTVAVTGFFESLTGAISFTGTDVPYRFDGVVWNGALTARFTAPNSITGVIASSSTTIS
jgi:hypothetical protein